MATLTESLGTDIRFRTDLVRRTDAGDIDTLSGLDNVLWALLRRLMTDPGTVVHRPDYGVGVGRYQGRLQHFSVREELASRIEEQFLRDPRVEKINSVTITIDDLAPDKTVIAVSVKIVGWGDRTMRFIPFGDAPESEAA